MLGAGTTFVHSVGMDSAGARRIPIQRDGAFEPFMTRVIHQHAQPMGAFYSRDIRKLHVGAVHEPDPLRQTLWGVHPAVVSPAKHNDFETH